MIRQLLQDHEAVIKQIRDAVAQTDTLGDAGTSNFLQELMTEHEKTAWMLRSYLVDL